MPTVSAKPCVFNWKILKIQLCHCHHFYLYSQLIRCQSFIRSPYTNIIHLTPLCAHFNWSNFIFDTIRLECVRMIIGRTIGQYPVFFIFFYFDVISNGMPEVCVAIVSKFRITHCHMIFFPLQIDDKKKSCFDCAIDIEWQRFLSFFFLLSFSFWYSNPSEKCILLSVVNREQIRRLFTPNRPE